MTIRDQARVIIRRKLGGLKDALAQAEAATLNEAHQAATELSSGPYSLSQLAKMGHPYSVSGVHNRRVGISVSLPPGIINVQTGAFRAAWAEEQGAWTADGPDGKLVSTLANRDEAAQWMKGTKLMVPRPILAGVKERIRVSRRQRLKAVIRSM